MKQLFLRHFSSIHVHYVPSDSSETLGTSEIIRKQHERLFHRVRSDGERVQRERERAWTKFDSKQMSLVFNYVFKHLAARNEQPFDFSCCRSQVDPPETLEGHLSEFLELSLKGSSIETNFSHASKVVASYLVRNACYTEGMGKYIPALCVGVYE